MIKHASYPSCELYHSTERHIVAWIEVDRAVVSERAAAQSGLPWMHGNRTELHEVQKRLQITANEARRFLSVLRLHLGDAHAGRHTRAGVLLVERRTLDAVWKSLENERSVFQQRKEQRGNPSVIAHQITLGEPAFPKIDLAKTGHVQRSTASEV